MRQTSTAVEGFFEGAKVVRLLFGCLLVSLLFASNAHAHESLPVVVGMEEQESGNYLVNLRMPGNILPSQYPQVEVAAPCEARAQSRLTKIYACPDGYRPDKVALRWPGGAPPSAILFKTQFIDGSGTSDVFEPGASVLTLPEQETAIGIIASYIWIGMEHILFGIDHLLFLICLVLLAKTGRKIALTVTGFTVGHAITISLASLGLVLVDGLLVEALIALSIVFVATELVRNRQETLFYRCPVLVAGGFGTLHGLGFAGALSEIGLAQTSVTLSLIGFNLGVEFGQLLFVIAMITAITIFRKSQFSWQEKAGYVIRTASLTLIGVLASFWFWERSLNLMA